MDSKFNKEKNRFSFQKGWSQVPIGQVSKVRVRLMAAMGITTRMAFLNRLNGVIEHKVSEYEAIEKIFKEMGITKIWGDV